MRIKERKMYVVCRCAKRSEGTESTPRENVTVRTLRTQTLSTISLTP